MDYLQKKPLLLQIFLYLYFLDGIVNVIAYLIEPSIIFSTDLIILDSQYISFLLIVISIMVVFFNFFYLYPLRWLFFILPALVVLQFLAYTYISSDSLKYIDIFEYQMYAPAPPPHSAGPTKLFYQLFASLQFILAAVVYVYIYRQQVINKLARFKELAFVYLPFNLTMILKICTVSFLTLSLVLMISEAIFHLFIKNTSGGFLQIKNNQLISIVKYYRHKDKDINLYFIPMMHVAQSNFYSQIMSETYPKNTIALTEGVSDRRKLFKTDPGYDALAKELNLVSQHKLFNLSKEGIKVVPADLDTSAFDSTTIKELNNLFNSNNLKPSFRNLLNQRITNKTLFTNIIHHLKVDLIDKRNAHLLDKLAIAEQKYQDIIIPWGALHMRGLEAEILKNGYKQFDTKQYVMLDIWHLIQTIYAK